MPVCMKCRIEFKTQFIGQRVCRVCKSVEKRTFRTSSTKTIGKSQPGSRSNGSGHEY